LNPGGQSSSDGHFEASIDEPSEAHAWIPDTESDDAYVNVPAALVGRGPTLR